MISHKLKNIFIFSIPVFIAHGLEEYFTGLYNNDWSIQFISGFLESMSTPQAIFLVFQIMLWLALVVFALLIISEKWRLRLMVIPGLVYIFELYHILKSVSVAGYYPGLITSLLFPVIAVFFWVELIRNYKNA
ncbi:MAG: hypothetical protein UX71_C0001G0151 [Parcubacteria group bacterium GW2011_GWA1_47_10]|nr:MAG: hypothetical protein UX71_C0001G0151 [Parcubacteria group bacterium GW2011_GWA1_47_10]